MQYTGPEDVNLDNLFADQVETGETNAIAGKLKSDFTTDPRLRFGVGNDFGKGQQVDYVLGEWTSEDLEIINPKVEKAAEAVKAFGTMELRFVMNQFNG